MSFFDFNDAPEQKQFGDLIPAKTLAKCVVMVRPGGKGDGGYLTVSDTGFEYLNLEFTICSEPLTKRKVFQNAGVGGTTDGHQKAAEITRSLLRAMLESANNIDPKDESDKARAARRIQNWGDLDELICAVEIGIEKNEKYGDKNKIMGAITPAHKEYKRIMAGETIVPSGSKKTETTATTTNSAVPDWAK
jgi:hypothetical protein